MSVVRINRCPVIKRVSVASGVPLYLNTAKKLPVMPQSVLAMQINYTSSSCESNIEDTGLE